MSPRCRSRAFTEIWISHMEIASDMISMTRAIPKIISPAN